ncbi:MAG: RNA polymerase sigma factor RpoD/SigA [bacterium]
MKKFQKTSKNKKSIKLERVQRSRYYLDEISKIPVLPRSEEMALIIRAQKGDQQAAERLICANLRFVVRVAREYRNRGLPLVDLISEGNIGLMRALETFDQHKGTKFITYAVWWIRQTIIQALYNKSHLVRLPQNHLRKMRQNLRAMESLEKKFNRPPAAVEIAEALVNEGHGSKSTTEYLQTQQSLDAPLDHDSTKSLIHIIPDVSTSPPDADLNSESLKKEMNVAFKVLEKRERKILQLLYGLEGDRPLNLGEVGQFFGVSRERVRQIRNEALAKLRRSKQVKNTLRGYLE